jgi:succinate dehydrogenase / fumarate reductase, cytochrome b subunit
VRRAFSLTGAVPLASFLVLHLAMNARALHGDAAFVSAVRGVHQVPGLALLEVLFVYAPLAVHGGIGLWLTATGRSLGPAPYSPSMRAAMRVTGVALALFLAMHLPELRFAAPRLPLTGGQLATRLDAHLSSVSYGVPWRGLAYLVGTACAVFHLAVGAWAAFAATEGGRASIQRRRWAAWTFAALGAVMWLTFADVVVYRATGVALFGDAVEEPPGSCP